MVLHVAPRSELSASVTGEENGEVVVSVFVAVRVAAAVGGTNIDDMGAVVIFWASQCYLSPYRITNPTVSSDFVKATWRRACETSAPATPPSTSGVDTIAIAGSQYQRFYVTSEATKPFHTRARAVSTCYFTVMGMRPELGRDFRPEDEEPGQQYVVILSHRFWTQHFNADPQAVGQALRLNEESYTIVGVMPPDYRDSLKRCALFWVPLPLNLERWGGGTTVYARMKSDVRLEQAQEEMDIVEARMIERHPGHKNGYTVNVAPYFAHQLRRSRTYLYPP